MNRSTKNDLNNIGKSDNTDNKKSDLPKNIENLLIDNKDCKPKKIIKKIIQINPEKIKNLGIADQILAAVRKLDANNDLPPSINIDLSKVKNIKSQNFKIPTIRAKKSLEPIPSTSKASIQPFEKELHAKSNVHENNDKLNVIKGTLSKFLQGRKNAKLTKNSAEPIKLPSELSGENKKRSQKKLSTQIIKPKTIKSPNIEDNLNNSTEIQEEFLLNSILNDSTDEPINTDIEQIEINTNPKKNDIILPVKSVPIHQYGRQRKISDCLLQSTNQLEPKVRILHEIRSEKKLDLLPEDEIKSTEKSIEISNLVKNNLEITFPNISPVKNPNQNLLFPNYDDSCNDMKIPSFSDLTSHIIEKWRNDSKGIEITDSIETENLPNIEIESTLKPTLTPNTETPVNFNNVKTELDSKTTASSSSRRRKIVPVGILNIKKNIENLKIYQSPLPAERSSTKPDKLNTDIKKISELKEFSTDSFTTKVTVNINGAQVTNYKPTRKRKSIPTTSETPFLATAQNKIMKIIKESEDKSTKHGNITLNLQEKNLSYDLKTQGNNSKIISECLPQSKLENINEIKNSYLQQERSCKIQNEDLQHEKLHDCNVLIKNSVLNVNIPKVDDQKQENEPLNVSKKLKEEDGVDFLVNLSDTINITDDCNSSSSESDLSLDYDTSDFFQKFPILRNDINPEMILNDNNDENNFLEDKNDNDIESHNYDLFNDRSINTIGNFQQNQNNLPINSFSNYETSPTQRKPIVIENKILKENEKIDLIYLKNIPCFETPTKSNHDIGQTIILQPCEFIKSQNSHQPANITEAATNKVIIISEEKNDENEDIRYKKENDENVKNDENEDISDEIITINQDEYTIEEICATVTDANPGISNICIIDENLIVNDENPTENIEENAIINTSSTLANEESTSNKLDINDTNVDLDGSELKVNVEKNDEDMSVVNTPNIIKNDEIKSSDNLKQPRAVKVKRTRGGKINLISRNKSNIKKSDNIAQSKNIEKSSEQLIEKSVEASKQFVDESANKETVISLQEDVKMSNKQNLKDSISAADVELNLKYSTSAVQELLQENQTQVIKNTTKNLSVNSPLNFESNSSFFDEGTELNIEKRKEFPEEDQKGEAPKDEINIEKQKEIEEEDQKGEKRLVENISENEIIDLKNTDVNLSSNKCGTKNDVDEEISRNSSLNDSLEMEEPFHGFDDTEIKLNNYELNEENSGPIVSIEDNDIPNTINTENEIENKFALMKNETETHNTESYITNTNVDKSPIKDNSSELTNVQRRVSQSLITNLEKDTLQSITSPPNKTDKKTPEKLCRKSSSHKSKKSTTKTSNTKDSTEIFDVKNMENCSDNSTSLDSVTKFSKKSSKRRILDSSEDDEDNIPLKKRSIRKSVEKKPKSMHGESSKFDKKQVLSESSDKIVHTDVILEKSSRKDSDSTEMCNTNVDSKLSTEKSKKSHKKHKGSKNIKQEIDQKKTDKRTTAAEVIISAENEVKKKISSNETLVVPKTDVINSNTKSKLDEIINFEQDISKFDISTPIKQKKRGRKPKNTTNEDIEVSSIKIQSETSEIKTPSRGRGRKTANRKIHPKLLLITNRSDIDKEDLVINDIKKLEKNQIQCGMCKEVILKTTWDKHKKNHYGIGWKMGEDGIDLSSHSAVLNSLINGFKTAKIKSLSCRLCNKNFASGLGILVHLEMCGLTDEEKRKQCSIICEHCNGEYSRYSLATHLKTCKDYRLKLNVNNENDDKKTTINDNNTNIIIGNTGRLKRKSMIRAEDKFKDINNTDFDVGDFIKAVTSVRGGQFRSWKKEITTNGIATCIGKGCNLKFNTYDEIREHVKICKFLTKSGYRCTRCTYHNDSIDEVRKHILNEHKLSQKDFHSSESEGENYDKENESSTENESSGVDENDEEDENRIVSDGGDSDIAENTKTTKKRVRGKIIKSSNKHEKIIDTMTSKDGKKLFREWTHYFFKYNYSNSTLFPNIIVNCKPSNMKLDLFEPKNNLSMKFSYSKIPMNQKFNSSKPLMDWMEMGNFKSAKFENEQLIFIGGPIISLKWLPINNEKTTPQYLAITYKQNYNNFIKSINTDKQKTLILIYKIGLTTEFNNIENLGNFEYGITYNDGPINDIDFLPSGGYIPEINRLGLLSIASSLNNDIIIYSLPIKAPQNCDIINDTLNLIDLEIGMQLKLKLLININEKSDEIYNVTPTKICWSQAKEHNVIVAGYTNGFIAIWNLIREDNLNFFEINDIPTFLPINYFKASNKSITGLDLHYNSNGTRWLILTTRDRNYKIIDIEDPCNPIIITEDIVKTFITKTVWPIIWENPCYSTSDELYQSTVHTLSPLIIYYKYRRYSRHSSTVNDISFNNWYNIMACGCNNGDFSIELNGKMNLDVTQKYDKKLHSYTDLIRLDNDKIIDIKLTESIQFYDTDYRNKYGLIFGPIKLINKDLTFLQKERNPPINMNCYVKINRVACNNNENGKQLIAIGYENGFVRILYINNNNL